MLSEPYLAFLLLMVDSRIEEVLIWLDVWGSRVRGLLVGFEALREDWREEWRSWGFSPSLSYVRYPPEPQLQFLHGPGPARQAHLVSSLPQVTPLPRFWNNYHLPLSFWPRRRRVPFANVLVATWTSIWLLGFAILGVTKSIPHSHIQGISRSWLGLTSTSSKSERRLIAHLLLCWHSFSFPVVS